MLPGRHAHHHLAARASASVDPDEILDVDVADHTTNVPQGILNESALIVCPNKIIKGLAPHLGQPDNGIEGFFTDASGFGYEMEVVEKTLDDTVGFFDLILETKLTAQEKKDLVAFLKAL